MARYEAILFDFDGVLVDSEPVHYECWMEALNDLNIQLDWSSFAKYCVGVPDRAAVEWICRVNPTPVDVETAWARHDRKSELFQSRMSLSPPFRADVVELVKSFSDYKMAVVTASARGEIVPLLERAQICDCFGALVCGEDVVHKKPAPDPYLLAAKLLGVSSALAVEDSDTGAASGAAAGFDVLRISGPSELPKLLRERLAQ